MHNNNQFRCSTFPFLAYKLNSQLFTDCINLKQTQKCNAWFVCWSTLEQTDGVEAEIDFFLTDFFKNLNSFVEIWTCYATLSQIFYSSFHVGSTTPKHT